MICSHPVVVFRADATESIGGGHVMRCLTLADAMADAGWICSFATIPETLKIVPSLCNSDHGVNELQCLKDKEPEKLADWWSEGCDLLVVDHYERDVSFELECRPWARKIMVIDDYVQRQHSCDFLLDQTYARNKTEYVGHVPQNCQSFLGSEYALLRPQFAELRPGTLKRRENQSDVSRLLITLGACEPKNITGQLLEAVEHSNINNKIEIDVILGSYSPFAQDLRERTSSWTRTVNIHEHVSDIATMMAKADVSIGAAGGTSMERCCLGLPSILLKLAENQQSNITALSQYGAAIDLGSPEDICRERLGAALDDLCTNAVKRREMSRACAGLCDGLGSQRVLLSVMPPIQTRNNLPLTLRFATPEDSDIVFTWQTHSETRRFFRNPKAPKKAEHQQWYQDNLRKSDRSLYIIQVNNEPVGTLRADKCIGNRTGLEISIAISPERYGAGIGTAALAFARNVFCYENLWAEILPMNKASQAIFKKAGFIPNEANWHVSKSCQKPLAKP